MVSSKPRGAISGCQYIAGGDIMWQRNLPEKCNMTSDLRQYLIKILVGLMEADPECQWTFEKYKSEVTQILALKRISILYCDEQTIHQLYMAPSKSVAEFKDRVAYYTDVEASYQNLYYNQHRFSIFLKGRLEVEAFPPTDLNRPICLMSKQYRETNINLRLSLEPYDSFNIMSSMSGDIQVATSQCDTINNIFKKMKEAEAAIKGSSNFSLTLWSDLQQKYTRMVKIYQLWNDSYQQLEIYLDLIKSSSDSNLQNGRTSRMNKIFKFQVLTEFYEKLKKIKGQLTTCQYEEVWCTPPVMLDNHWCTLVGTLFGKAKDILNRMQDRRKLNMTEIEQLQHSADRSELQELTARCVYLWQTPCATERKHSVKEYERCKKRYEDGVVKLTKLESELKNLDRAREKCKVKFQEEILKHLTSSTRNDARRSPEIHQEVSIAKNKPNMVQHVRIPSSLLPPRTDRSLRHLNAELIQHRSRFQREISELPEIQVMELDTEDDVKINVEQDSSKLTPVIANETEISNSHLHDGAKSEQIIKNWHTRLKPNGLKDEGYHTSSPNVLSPLTQDADLEDGESVTESDVDGHNDSTEENKVGASCFGYTQAALGWQVDTTTDNCSTENGTAIDLRKLKVPIFNLECDVPSSRVPQISEIEEGDESG
ncbi:serine/threonine-protein kinase TBK1 isoform X2 [Patella vulgata]|nr:serine/threonine-protein kinase TBK1 isoform X2 [Patella vulgata]